jgi:hypothetical protein
MRDIKIKVNDEGYVSAYEKFIGNQYEHEATRLLFELPDCYKGDNLFQYVVFTLCDGTVKIRQMVEDACVIDRDITNVTGLLLMEVVIKNIENAEDLTSGKVMNSQVISGFIKPAGYNPDNIISESIDKNVILYLDEFDALLAEIRQADIRFADIIDGNPSSLTEVKDARGGYALLKNRLDVMLTNINDNTARINALASGSPLVADSISEMTNQNRVYVNTTDGNWYYYDGSNWTIGGVYQSTKLENNSVSPYTLDNATKELVHTRIPELTIIEGEYVRFNNKITELANTFRSEPFLLYAGETIVLNAKGYAGNVAMISLCNADKSYINMQVCSIDNYKHEYRYTALNDVYIMISYLPGGCDYYIYKNNSIDEIKDMNYGESKYNSLLITDDINYRRVTHVFNTTSDLIFKNETNITVDTDDTLASNWNWSVFKNFDVSDYADGNHIVTAVLDIKCSDFVELYLLNNGYATIKDTIIRPSEDYQRVIISATNPQNNNTVRVCIGSKQALAQQNEIAIRLIGLFIDQKDVLVLNNPLTINDFKYLIQEKNICKYPAMSIIGDSYSAYKGWIPSDGRWSWYKPEGNTGTNDVNSVTQMWWYILANMLKTSLLYLDGWSGSTICTTGQNGADVSNSAMVNRAETSLGVNRVLQPKPNLIFIFGGTNDSWLDSPIGEVKYSDWTIDDLKSVLPAFCKMIDTIKTYNPGARIVNVINTDIKSSIQNGMISACEYYGIDCIIPQNVSKQSGHPDQSGMLTIAQELYNFLNK